mmetsp:Transcript_18748/g.48825  ORF Transcript_18748/g.48825 Transcript_18748/m.48825 type:complete len:405 (-) Transcript_18748:772-1986(-)
MVWHAALDTFRPVPSPWRSMSERGSSTQLYPLNCAVDLFMYVKYPVELAWHTHAVSVVGSSTILLMVLCAWYAKVGVDPTAVMTSSCPGEVGSVYALPATARVSTTVRCWPITVDDTTVTDGGSSVPGPWFASLRSVTWPAPSTMMAYGRSSIDEASKPTPNQTPVGPVIAMVALAPSCATVRFTRPPRFAVPARATGDAYVLMYDVVPLPAGPVAVTIRPKQRNLPEENWSEHMNALHSSYLAQPASACSTESQVHCPWNSPVHPYLASDGRHLLPQLMEVLGIDCHVIGPRLGGAHVADDFAVLKMALTSPGVAVGTIKHPAGSDAFATDAEATTVARLPTVSAQVCRSATCAEHTPEVRRGDVSTTRRVMRSVHGHSMSGLRPEWRLVMLFCTMCGMNVGL